MGSKGGLPSNMDCSLVGSDKKEGTIPMYVIPFSNKVFGYIVSSSLFILMVTSIYFLLKPKIDITQELKKYITSGSILVFITSFILFYRGNAKQPYELVFGIIGIVISSIAIYLTIDMGYIKTIIDRIREFIKVLSIGSYEFIRIFSTGSYVFIKSLTITTINVLLEILRNCFVILSSIYMVFGYIWEKIYYLLGVKK